MLVLSRKLGESIRIDDHINVTVVSVAGGRVRLGIEAPADVRIMRSEIDEWSELSFGDSQAVESETISTSA